MKIVKVGSLACTSCIIMDNIFNDIKDNYNFLYEEYDYDLDNDKIQEFDIGKKLPVYIVFKDNNELGRVIGEKKEKEFVEELERLINEAV